VFLLFSFCSIGIEPRALCILGKHSPLSCTQPLNSCGFQMPCVWSFLQWLQKPSTVPLV
jgi:hypothetical protein